MDMGFTHSIDVNRRGVGSNKLWYTAWFPSQLILPFIKATSTPAGAGIVVSDIEAVFDSMTKADWDTMLKSLSKRERRRLLVDLMKENHQDDRRDALRNVHDEERDIEELQAELIHQHLPQLEASGYIWWDRENHEIMTGPKFNEIRPLLELIQAHKDELPNGWI